MAKAKIQTGIKGFDEALQGGLNKGYAILVRGPLGSGKTALTAEFIYRGAMQFNTPGIFVTLAERPNNIISHLQNFGWDFAKLIDEKKIKFVDLTPACELTEEISSKCNLEPIFERIKSAVNEIGAKRVAIDGIDHLYYRYSNAWIVKQLIYRIFDELKKMELVLLTSSEENQFNGIENYISDGVIDFSKEWDDSRLKRVMTCSKMNNSFPESKVNFIISRAGLEFFSEKP